jgi:Flp pilus assembly protein protease CpaA
MHQGGNNLVEVFCDDFFAIASSYQRIFHNVFIPQLMECSMEQVVFFAITGALLLIASWRDLKTREVPDTLSYGLILLGILGGLALAVLHKDIWIFTNHLVGFAAGCIIGTIMYYGRQWGGGDAKLMMGMGAVLGLSFQNMQLAVFVVLLALCGALWGVLALLHLAFVQHRRKFLPAFKEYIRRPAVHRLRITLVVTGILIVIALFFVNVQLRIILGFALIAIYLLLYSWIFSRVVETSILTKTYPVSKLTEGDWITHEVRVGKHVIVPEGSTGVTLEQISKLKKAKVKEVIVKEGIAFVPAFLLAFAVLLVLAYHFHMTEIIAWFISS